MDFVSSGCQEEENGRWQFFDAHRRSSVTGHLRPGGPVDTARSVSGHGSVASVAR